jgi:hypothetical protein
MGIHCFAWGKWEEKIVSFEAPPDASVRYLLSSTLSRCAELDVLAEKDQAAWTQRSVLARVGP